MTSRAWSTKLDQCPPTCIMQVVPDVGQSIPPNPTPMPSASPGGDLENIESITPTPVVIEEGLDLNILELYQFWDALE